MCRSAKAAYFLLVFHILASPYSVVLRCSDECSLRRSHIIKVDWEKEDVAFGRTSGTSSSDHPVIVSNYALRLTSAVSYYIGDSDDYKSPPPVPPLSLSMGTALPSTHRPNNRHFLSLSSRVIHMNTPSLPVIATSPQY